MARSIEGRTLDEVLTLFKPRVARFLSGLVGDRADVDDLTQETLLRIVRGWESFRGESPLSSWIFRIASNVGIDAYRRQAVRPGGTADPLERIAVDDSPQRRIERRQMADCVLKEMDALPGAYARVLTLREFEGLTHKEIAEREGCGVDAVKVRLMRARKRFRAILETACHFSKEGDDVLRCEPKRGGDRDGRPGGK